MEQGQTLFLTVRNREQLLVNEEIDSLTSYNDKGVFDVLPEHANFISLIRLFISIKKVGGKTLMIKLDNGIMRVFGKKIDVFLGIKK